MIDRVEMVVVVGDDSGVQVAGIDGNWFSPLQQGCCAASIGSAKTLDLLFWIWLILTLNIVIVSDKGSKNGLFVIGTAISKDNPINIQISLLS